jgi:hypothetical protein
MTHILADAVIKPICEVLGVEYADTARIVIDLAASDVVRIHVVMYATPQFLDLDWGKILEGAAVVKVGETVDFEGLEQCTCGGRQRRDVIIGWTEDKNYEGRPAKLAVRQCTYCVKYYVDRFEEK